MHPFRITCLALPEIPSRYPSSSAFRGFSSIYLLESETKVRVWDVTRGEIPYEDQKFALGWNSWFLIKWSLFFFFWFCDIIDKLNWNLTVMNEASNYLLFQSFRFFLIIIKNVIKCQSPRIKFKYGNGISFDRINKYCSR